MVRYLTGTLVQLGKGEISLDQIEKALDPDQDPGFQPLLAYGYGLTLYKAEFEEGYLSTTPTIFEEKQFLKCHKRKLEEKGMKYEIPPEEDIDISGGLFD